MSTLTLAAIGCGGGHDMPPPGDLVLEPQNEMGDTTQIKPGGDGEVVFGLRRGDVPEPGVEVRFIIYDDPASDEDDAHGATLGATRATTEEQGQVRVVVHAGLEAIVPVRALVPNVPFAQTTVFIGNGDYGAVDVAPFLTSGAGTRDVVDIVVSFFDGGSCRDFPVQKPPTPVRPTKLVPKDGTARFTSVSTIRGHAALAQGRDGAGRVRAAGCVDLPGSTLFVRGLVELPVPVAPLVPTTSGIFTVQSHLDIPTLPFDPSAGWRNLTDCDQDPAQLWIDCTIDAIRPDDALDCVPADEGRLGLSLSTHRGAIDGARPECRTNKQPNGLRSVDDKVRELFGVTPPKMVGDLREAAAEAGHLLDGIDLQSRLALVPIDGSGTLQADHVFETATFGSAGDSPVPVTLAGLGIPELAARAFKVIDNNGKLEVSEHGVTIRLGTAARAALVAQSLRPRELAERSTDLIADLIGLATLATSDFGELHGCAALDYVLCNESGEPVGCALSACNVGLGAMAKVLDAGFNKLDGEGIDLLLKGSGPAYDLDGDGVADRIGDRLAVPPNPGLWTVRIIPRGGEVPAFGGTFIATKD